MGQDQVACFSSYFRLYATILTLFVIAISSFLIHSIFSEQIMMVNLLPGLHLLYTELFVTSLLLPLSVVLFILTSKRRHLLQCNEGKFPMVEVIGLVVNLLCIAALVAGAVLSWSAATTIDERYQVRQFILWECLYYHYETTHLTLRYWATVFAPQFSTNSQDPPFCSQTPRFLSPSNPISWTGWACVWNRERAVMSLTLQFRGSCLYGNVIPY